MTDWPKTLISDLARRRCVIVVGSGVSRQAIGEDGQRPPVWQQFLISANQELRGGPEDHITNAINAGDLLHACEWLQRRWGHEWTNLLRRHFSAPRFRFLEVHKNIIRLDSRIIFSLNFDNIIDRAMDDVLGGTGVVKNYYDEGVSEFLRGTDRYLIKFHGSLNEVDRLIFTQKQYARARVKSAPFYEAFDSALLTHTFLFLGAGHRDPDINLILENQKFTYDSLHPHYILSSQGMSLDLKQSLRENRNLEVVEYDPVDDEHSGFCIAIDALLSKVTDERESIASYDQW